MIRYGKTHKTQLEVVGLLQSATLRHEEVSLAGKDGAWQWSLRVEGGEARVLSEEEYTKALSHTDRATFLPILAQANRDGRNLPIISDALLGQLLRRFAPEDEDVSAILEEALRSTELMAVPPVELPLLAQTKAPYTALSWPAERRDGDEEMDLELDGGLTDDDV